MGVAANDPFVTSHLMNVTDLQLATKRCPTSYYGFLILRSISPFWGNNYVPRQNSLQVFSAGLPSILVLLGWLPVLLDWCWLMTGTVSSGKDPQLVSMTAFISLGILNILHPDCFGGLLQR